MALEHIEITHGSGTNVATDQLGTGEHVQYIKIMDGTADSNTVLPVDATYGLPIDIKRSVSLVVLGSVASGSADSGAPVKVGGKYNSIAPTFSDGQRGDLQITVSGFLKTELSSLLAGEDLTNLVMAMQVRPVAGSAYGMSTDNQMTQVTKRNSKNSAGNVFGFYVTNDNAAVRYFQIHNKASAPAGGDVPVLSFKIPAGTANNPGVLVIGRDVLGAGGHYLSTGVSWALSTTYGTFTDSATNTEHIVALKYI